MWREITAEIGDRRLLLSKKMENRFEIVVEERCKYQKNRIN